MGMNESKTTASDTRLAAGTATSDTTSVSEGSGKQDEHDLAVAREIMAYVSQEGWDVTAENVLQFWEQCTA